MGGSDEFKLVKCDRWNRDKLASGVYFYQLKADEFTATLKMTLLK